MARGTEIGRAIVGDDRPCVVGGAPWPGMSAARKKEGMRDGERLEARGEGRGRGEREGETRRAYKVFVGCALAHSKPRKRREGKWADVAQTPCNPRTPHHAATRPPHRRRPGNRRAAGECIAPRPSLQVQFILRDAIRKATPFVLLFLPETVVRERDEGGCVLTVPPGSDVAAATPQ